MREYTPLPGPRKQTGAVVATTVLNDGHDARYRLVGHRTGHRSLGRTWRHDRPHRSSNRPVAVAIEVRRLAVLRM